ncbi:MAG: undecaprenyl-phosphate alpha-N-acetylglucosaminyl 1-phosphate transferase [Gemmatimonadota bacterium]|nr:MAG: undecaprenyl-phosphate alpha-N-acetylglucosaminyl 1-phosphate transferase [Gemmatimonadota bacterium]
MVLLLTLITALAGALLLTPVARRVALRTGYVAWPSGRGVHREPTPVLGGVAIFFAFLIAVGVGASLSGALTTGRMLGYLGGATLIFIMGVVDDRVDLSWFSKLLGQIVAAVLLLASENAGGIFLLSPIGLVLALLWLVGLTNALNFLDNMDGLCAGIAAIIAFTFAGLALLSGQLGTAVLAVAVAGAAIGFLRFNFPPGSIFLGDGGSLFLGYSLASLGIMTAERGEFSYSLLVPVIAIAYPIFDISFVSVTRYARGQSLAQGGRDHSSHRLARILGSDGATAWVTYGICAALGILAIVLQALSFAPATLVGFLGVAFALMAFGVRLCRLAPVPDRSAAVDPAVS